MNIRIYSNTRKIFKTNTYSAIRSCQIFYTNIFGYSFVLIFLFEYIRIFIRVQIFTNATLCLECLLTYNCHVDHTIGILRK